MMSPGLFSPSLRLLLWCLGGSALVFVFLDSPNFPLPPGFSPIFWYLLKTFDVEGNLIFFLLVPLAFLLRGNTIALNALEQAGRHPWRMAAIAFPLLCLGSIHVYHDHPLSLDEYSVLLQAKVFAEGRLSGLFPPELLDRLIPRGFQGMFISVSRDTGAVATSYWPGFSLLLAPFAWLGVPWMANPLIGALSIPAVHRLAREVSGSEQAGAWAAWFALASPAVIASSISYYTMQSHFLFNVLFAILLLRPTVPRAFLAGLLGSFALTLHQPLPHFLFALPFIGWLAFRGGSWRILAALLLSYLPLWLLIGIGWRLHLSSLASTVAAAAVSDGQPPRGALELLLAHVLSSFSIVNLELVEVRAAWLTKIWTWAGAGLVVLAAIGYRREREQTSVRLLGAALVLTFVGYCFVPVDQGHGWGFRYIHSAWFVLPVLAALALTGMREDGVAQLRAMAGWCVLLSLIVVNGFRMNQVEEFMGQHLQRVPPLATAPSKDRPELVLVNLGYGFYPADLVQNDPFLRSPRVIMVQGQPRQDAAMLSRWYPDYEKVRSGQWGEHWVRKSGAGR